MTSTRRRWHGRHPICVTGSVVERVCGDTNRKLGRRASSEAQDRRRPGDAGRHPARIAPPATARAAGDRATTVERASSRYTPPVPQSAKESPPWVPVLMLVLFAVGALAIMLRYLVFSDSNWPMIVGLVCLLGGLYTRHQAGDDVTAVSFVRSLVPRLWISRRQSVIGATITMSSRQCRGGGGSSSGACVNRNSTPQTLQR